MNSTTGHDLKYISLGHFFLITISSHSRTRHDVQMLNAIPLIIGVYLLE